MQAFSVLCHLHLQNCIVLFIQMLEGKESMEKVLSFSHLLPLVAQQFYSLFIHKLFTWLKPSTKNTGKGNAWGCSFILASAVYHKGEKRALVKPSTWNICANIYFQRWNTFIPHVLQGQWWERAGGTLPRQCKTLHHIPLT